jgi:exodeoxyribonuclease VII large subunit
MDGMPIVSVTDLMWKLKDTVEEAFPWVCVLGELSNVTYARSGHVYFTLKDDRSEIRGVVWSRTASSLKFKLKDGLQVLATGPVEVYAARGSVQLIVEHVLPQGMGELELAFRQLQEKLKKEGLFEREHKQPLPRFPKRIAIITSPTGAAIRDMLKVLTRRWRASDVIVLPAQVQGPTAAGQIARAIKRADTLRDVDVIIAGRGGGSLEDLWAFNEEVVARAIFECTTPVISAVGHEVDVSIADLVADVRAATPTDAGQMVVPDQLEVNAYLEGCSNRLQKALLTQLQTARTRLAAIESRRVFSRPSDRIHEHTASVDALGDRLMRAASNRLNQAKNQFTQVSRQLDALSPLKVLARGYSITELAETNKITESIKDVTKGQRIRTRLADGEIISEVLETNSNP